MLTPMAVAVLGALVWLCSPAPAHAVTNYLVMAIPSSNQVTQYSRPLHVERFQPVEAKTESVTFEYQGGRPQVDAIRLRVRYPDNSAVEHGPVIIDASRRAVFQLNLPTGRYALEPRPDASPLAPAVVPLGESIVVGEPEDTGGYFRCVTRFERQYAVFSGPVQCAWFELTEWPPRIPTIHTVLPTGLQPFPRTKLTAEEFARLAYVQDVLLYAKEKSNFVQMPNPAPGRAPKRAVKAVSFFPTYFRASIYGTRIPLTEGDPPLVRLGHAAKALFHPQGRGVYACEVNGRIGLLETTGRYTTFAGYKVSDSMAPHYSELTVSPVDSDRAFARERIVWHGDWAPDTPAGMLRIWGCVGWPSPAPHHKGLHKFIVPDTYHFRLLFVDHVPQHGPDDPEGPGPGGQSRISTFLGTYGRITHPCFDHPWDTDIDFSRPVSEPHRDTVRWIYWTARGGSPSTIGAKNQPYASGTARICRAKIDLATGAAIGGPEVFLESGYPQDSEVATLRMSKGTYSVDGPRHTRARFPEFAADGRPGFILPNAMGFTSRGELWFVEQCAQRMRVVDVETKQVTTRRTVVGKALNCHEITAQMDVDGVVGPVDTLYGGTYGVQSDFVVYPDGTERRIWPWTGLSPLPGDNGSGPMHQTVAGFRGNYQWVCAPGNKALPVLACFHQAVGGMAFIHRRLPDQPPMDRAKLERGFAAWKTSHDDHPAPGLLGGPKGFNALPAVGFVQLGQTWPRDRATAWLKSQGLSDEEADAVHYTATYQMRHKKALAEVPALGR